MGVASAPVLSIRQIQRHSPRFKSIFFKSFLKVFFIYSEKSANGAENGGWDFIPLFLHPPPAPPFANFFNFFQKTRFFEDFLKTFEKNGD